jgi:membrane protease YdiL (CAAX protease family)
MPHLRLSFMTADPPQGVERDFHIALATAFVPVLLLPVAWWLAIRAWFGRASAPGRHERAWRRRLLAIAVWDSLVALVVIGAVQVRGELSLPEPPARGTPRIGVQLDASWPGDGAKVSSVWPDSPADRAGLVPGDVVVAVDGVLVRDWEALTHAVGAGLHEQPRMLLVDRAEGVQANLRVVPEVGLETPTPLFSAEGGTTCRQAWETHAAVGLWPVAAGVGLVMLLWLFVRIRQPGRPHRWGLVVIPLLVAPAVGLGVAQGMCVAIGGWSMGIVLVGTIAQGLALLVGGIVLLRWLGSELDVIVGPRLGIGRASGRAVLYISAAFARAILLLAVMWSLLPTADPIDSEGANLIFEAAQGPAGVALVLFAVGVVAPLAEEVVFRGVLLAGLARRIRPGLALVLTAVVFGLFHVPSHGFGAIMPAMLGLVFGWARLRTGGLTAPILLHAGNNLLVSVLALIA